MIRFSYVGKSLKETSLDETVQVLNMLKGEMSLIGPRASEWGALESYQQNEVDKMKVRPGITGYTQAYFRNSITIREKRLKDVLGMPTIFHSGWIFRYFFGSRAIIGGYFRYT